MRAPPYRPGPSWPVCLVLVLAGPALAAPLYGPGRHWVDRVKHGYAAFGADASVGVDLDFDGQANVTIGMTGSTEVFRSDARPPDGSTSRHRSHIDLEIVAMHLAGELPGFGTITMDAGDGVGNQAGDGPLYSQGGSDELADDPRRSADFFDLFMEVHLGTVTLHNVVPLRVVAVIDQLPPIGTRFTSEGAPVPFVNESGTPVLQVVSASDVPTPPRRGPCDPAGADVDGLATALVDAATQCSCGPRFGRCARRLIATRARSGQLNRGCRALARRCFAPAVCEGRGTACGTPAG